MNYDAVIFDLFGTLVDNVAYLEDTSADYYQTLSNVAAALSIPLEVFLPLWAATEDERYTGFFPSMEAYLKNLCQQSGRPANSAQISHAVKIRLDFFSGLLTPRDDTLDTLSRLRASGYKIGLVSDCAIEDSIFWPSTPMATLVDVAILSCEVGLRKPDPLIYQMVCDRLAVLPDECLYVGDGGSMELTGASALGMDVVLIRAPYDTVNGDREEWQGTRISSLNEVLAIVGDADCPLRGKRNRI